MYTYRVDELQFNEDTKVTPTAITVIIGPNNCGKSRALRDIVGINTARSGYVPKVISKVDFPYPKNIEQLCVAHPSIEPVPADYGTWEHIGLGIDLTKEHRTSGGLSWPIDYTRELFNPENSERFSHYFGPSLIAFLATASRLSLVKDSESPSTEKQSANLLQALYNSPPSVEQEIRGLVKSVFNLEVALDYTIPQRVSLRVAKQFAEIPGDPREARKILHRYELIDSQGDGLKAFVAIATALLCVKRPVFLIDEPEAFLHPPQAFRMGRFLGGQGSSSRQLFVATHSADVLRGLLSATHDVTIIRLDRIDDTTKLRLLAPERVEELATDPLLNSSRVLDGLFYSTALIVEGDSDARFYHSAFQKRAPELDLHVVNAANKQLVPRISALYREMGVRHAGIVDIDVLNDAKEFLVQVKALEFDDAATTRLVKDRDDVAKAVNQTPPDSRIDEIKHSTTELLKQLDAHSRGTDATNLLRAVTKNAHENLASTKSWNEVKRRGVAALPGAIQPTLEAILESFATKGLFIVSSGQLESLLEDYGIQSTNDKKSWIKQALQLLPGLTPDPSKQLWSFVDQVRHYYQNL